MTNKATMDRILRERFQYLPRITSAGIYREGKGTEQDLAALIMVKDAPDYEEALARVMAAAPRLLMGTLIALDYAQQTLANAPGNSDERNQALADIEQLRQTLDAAGYDATLGRCQVCGEPDIVVTLRDDGGYWCEACKRDEAAYQASLRTA